MILKEDYTLSYNLFLAEHELFNSLINKSSIVLQESLSVEDYSILCEGLQDTITNYINKVTASMQQVWDRFIATVGTDAQKDYLTKAADKVKSGNPRFVINNFPNYDTNVFIGYKVQRYNRQTMTDDLKTQKGYMQKNYASLYSERNNMNVMLQKAVTRGYTNIRCDKVVLTKAYNFCSTGFYEIRQSIENDINIINESANTILQGLQMVQSTQESNMFYESIIIEALTSGTPENKATKMSFVDSDGAKVEPGAKGAQNQNSFINKISNYMKISTNLISAKMKVLARMYKTNLDIVRHYVDITQYGDPVPNAQVQKVVTQTAQQSTN